MKDMKSVLVCLMMVMSVFGFTQKIDYENFDNGLATKALKDAYLVFMDTFTHFTTDPKFKIETTCPTFYNLPETRKIVWSDLLYKNVSYVSCSTLIAKKEFDHLDFSSWLNLNKTKMVNDYLSGFKSIPKIDYNYNYVSLEEVLFMCKNSNFETYQELANYMIKSWDKSPMHCGTIRFIPYDSYYYEVYNAKVISKFSCCVMYDKNTKEIKSCINIFSY